MARSNPTSEFNIMPEQGWRLLLHVCCAPCSAGIIEFLRSAGWDVTVFFYNPNIYPFEEYQRRKVEVVKFLSKLKIEHVDADYDPETWIHLTLNMDKEPERGKRCEVCFTMRLDKTAEYAQNSGFSRFATTLGISRWKDMEQVNRCGRAVAVKYPGLTFWDYNWRKQGGAVRMASVTKRENFYRQTYCGCIHSFATTKV